MKKDRLQLKSKYKEILNERRIQGEEMESIRVTMNYFISLKEQGISCIAITSHYSNQGKTDIVFKLGQALATYGVPTLVMDANYFAPSITERLQLEEQKGLLNMLEELEEESKEEAINISGIYESSQSNLSFFPLGFHNKRKVDNFYIEDKFIKLIESLKKRFGMILIEVPDMKHLSYVQSFAQATDTLALVLKSGELKVSESEEVKEKIKSLSKQICCCIFNTEKGNKKKAKTNNVNLIIPQIEVRKEEASPRGISMGDEKETGDINTNFVKPKLV